MKPLSDFYHTIPPMWRQGVTALPLIRLRRYAMARARRPLHHNIFFEKELCRKYMALLYKE